MSANQPPSWERIESIFDAVLDAQPAEREGLLQSLCEGDPKLRQRVEQLLRADEQSDGFLEQPSGHVIDALQQADRRMEERPMLDRVGPYRVVREVGRGGMGIVYLAERDDGHFEQRVALKCVGTAATGIGTEERFRDERTILARLEHPNIARLLDGGITQDGISYFAMEYVEGVPITDYCARNRLDTERKIRLFLDVCRAVEAAHGRLIVHRDLKPSNILVDGQGQVKLLDFGVAAILNAEDSTVGSGETQAPMTPAYAAPEQLQGEPATVVTDVFSLGLVLQELLTGERADRKGEIRLGPGFEAGNLDATDLEAIVRRAQHAEPGKRYASAESLRRELVRLQQHHPVEARNGSRAYRVRKFLRRNRLEASALGIVLLAVLTGAVVAQRQAAVARIERDRAQSAQQETAALNDFLIEEMLGAAAPEEAQGQRVTVQEVLDAASRRVTSAFPDQPQLEAAVRLTLGRTYASLGAFADAEIHLAGAAELFRAHRGESARETLQARTAMAELKVQQGQLAEALEELQRVRSIQLGRYGAAHLDTLHTDFVLANHALKDGRYTDSERQLMQLLDVLDRQHPSSWDLKLRGMSLMADALQLQRRNTEAEATCRKALEIQRERLGPDHPQTLRSEVVLGRILLRLERAEEARALLEETVRRHERVLGPDHRKTLDALSKLGSCYWDLDLNEQAHATFRQAFDRATSAHGKDDPATISLMRNTAMALRALGRYPEAEPLYREGAARSRSRFGPHHPSTLRSLRNLAAVLMTTGRRTEALSIYREFLEAGHRAAASPDVDATTLNDFAWFLLSTQIPELRDDAAALPLAERAVELSHRRQVEFLDTLAAALERNGRLQQAIAVQREALALPDAVIRYGEERYMAELLRKNGDDAGAEEFFLWNLERRRALLPADDPAIGETMRLLALLTAELERPAEAEAWFRQAGEQFRRGLPTGHWRSCRVQSEWGELQASLGHATQARSNLEQALDCIDPYVHRMPQLHGEIRERLVSFKD